MLLLHKRSISMRWFLVSYQQHIHIKQNARSFSSTFWANQCPFNNYRSVVSYSIRARPRTLYRIIFIAICFIFLYFLIITSHMLGLDMAHKLEITTHVTMKDVPKGSRGHTPGHTPFQTRLGPLSWQNLGENIYPHNIPTINANFLASYESAFPSLPQE